MVHDRGVGDRQGPGTIIAKHYAVMMARDVPLIVPHEYDGRVHHPGHRTATERSRRDRPRRSTRADQRHDRE
ncbi:MAG TPA: hypothetical protein DCL45_01365 [Chloroflexi bacterium]|nr:hypothetical protein [Chloroflexota bacterium]